VKTLTPPSCPATRVKNVKTAVDTTAGGKRRRVIVSEPEDRRPELGCEAV